MAKGDLQKAINVYFGEYITEYEAEMESIGIESFRHNNPEKTLIIKDSLEKMSKEAKLVMSVVFRMPAEMFDAGRIVNRKLVKFMKVRYNWSAKQVTYALDEIKAVYKY